MSCYDWRDMEVVGIYFLIGQPLGFLGRGAEERDFRLSSRHIGAYPEPPPFLLPTAKALRAFSRRLSSIPLATENSHRTSLK